VKYTPDDETRSLETLQHLAGPGWNVSIPDDYTLQIDLDDGAEKLRFERIAEILKNSGRFVFVSSSSHESRNGNTHAILTLSEPLGLVERIALQAILGSDPVTGMDESLAGHLRCTYSHCNVRTPEGNCRMSIPMHPDDPAYWLLERGRNDPSQRSTTTVYKSGCYICEDPEFALMEVEVDE